ncbi:hypothetical protein JJQ72_14905 [Paenibacillus sp. F411]|uniref:hypothetical protein n=1 Tax=Paenibacillus sp. F411 TaxID=2820239 RepID=UPI001AAEF3A8|nr:hypothetical protein [Paenibacillus sp. F411]MBO2945265.1 hypothetical protein [Paenibacillus sp. F411]
MNLEKLTIQQFATNCFDGVLIRGSDRYSNEGSLLTFCIKDKELYIVTPSVVKVKHIYLSSQDKNNAILTYEETDCFNTITIQNIEIFGSLRDGYAVADSLTT